jgi:F0F1-type ATP synthase assembly protein I
MRKDNGNTSRKLLWFTVFVSNVNRELGMKDEVLTIHSITLGAMLSFFYDQTKNFEPRGMLVSIFIRIIIKSFSGVQGVVFQKKTLAAGGKIRKSTSKISRNRNPPTFSFKVKKSAMEGNQGHGNSVYLKWNLNTQKVY